ncbi:MAG: tetratricopeptide repeat protein [Clostridia bacterium]|nr:tetratricopeptide repeat protein [Clostridia bacterium]
MQLLVNFGIPVLLVLMGGSAGGRYGQQFLGSVLGLIIALIYLSFIKRADLLMMKGSKAIKSGNTDAGIALYEKAINTKGLSTDYLIYAPFIFLRYGYEDKCLNALNKAEKLRALTPGQKKNLLITKGLYLWKTGEGEDAEKAFYDAHNMGIDSQTYSYIGFILMENKKYDEAYEFNKEAMEYNEDDASIMDNMALSYYHKGEIAEALSLYDKIMEKGTHFPVIYYNHALCLITAGDIGKAKEQLNKALSFKISHIAAVSGEEIEAKLKELGE